MNKFQLLLVGTAILGLVSCGDPKTSTPEASTQASMAAANPAAGFDMLQKVTANTTADVKNKKYAQAKTEFSKFEASWKEVEDGVKKKSSKTYDAIEANLDVINGELKNSQPNQTKATAALQALSQHLTSAAKL